MARQRSSCLEPRFPVPWLAASIDAFDVVRSRQEFCPFTRCRGPDWLEVAAAESNVGVNASIVLMKVKERAQPEVEIRMRLSHIPYAVDRPESIDQVLIPHASRGVG